MLNYMNEGGSIMWIIAALSLAALAVAIERLLFFRKASGDADKLEKELEEIVSSGYSIEDAPEDAGSPKAEVHSRCCFTTPCPSGMRTAKKSN